MVIALCLLVPYVGNRQHIAEQAGRSTVRRFAVACGSHRCIRLHRAGKERDMHIVVAGNPWHIAPKEDTVALQETREK
jgi:NCAIR mutase (PurE)-related protein